MCVLWPLSVCVCGYFDRPFTAVVFLPSTAELLGSRCKRPQVWHATPNSVLPVVL